jgi:hypothetical protein
VQYIYLQQINFVFVKRKRTQALLGSNLLAILFTDILYRRKVFGPSFFLYRNPIMAKENPMFDLAETDNNPSDQ